jgi:membrane protein
VLFSWYIASFGNYNATYGSLGAAIGMMTWMWISMIVILVGAQLNAETEQQAVPDLMVRREEPRARRGVEKVDAMGSRI